MQLILNNDLNVKKDDEIYKKRFFTIYSDRRGGFPPYYSFLAIKSQI